MTTKEENDEEKLAGLFVRMKGFAKENHQAVPTGYYLSEDKDTAYAEFENRNPTVLATRNENGVFESDFQYFEFGDYYISISKNR